VYYSKSSYPSQGVHARPTEPERPINLPTGPSGLLTGHCRIANVSLQELKKGQSYHPAWKKTEAEKASLAWWFITQSALVGQSSPGCPCNGNPLLVHT